MRIWKMLHRSDEIDDLHDLVEGCIEVVELLANENRSLLKRLSALEASMAQLKDGSAQ